MALACIACEDKYDGQVTEITLRPAPANILCAAMMEEISGVLAQLEKAPGKKLVVFTGEGQHFCYGASVEEHLPGQVEKMLPQFHRFIARILSCPVPTLAKVSGRCLGGGFELALACNFIFAASTAKLGVPEIKLGVFPPVACILLPRCGGEAVASQLILTGEICPAPWLQEKGIVTALAEEAALDGAVASWVEKNLLPSSASSLRLANQAARMPLQTAFQEQIGKLETLYLKNLMATQDAAQGLRSFLDKKTPRWENA